MKKQFFLNTIVALILVTCSVSIVSAQTSIGGDDVCGSSSSTVCTLQNAKTILGGFFTVVIELGSALLVVFILFRFVKAWFALQAGNANAYKIAIGQVGNAVLGFIIIVAIIGGFFMALIKFFGAQDWVVQFLQILSQSFIPHAYAQGTFLPNPLVVSNLYDFLLIFVRAVIRWFVFPALIIMWIWSGFAYVAAQGNPEKISKAHKWLLWAVISTVLVMITEGFLFALRATVQQVLS